MNTRKFKLVDVMADGPTGKPVVGDLAKEEEAELLRLAKEAIDPEMIEAELAVLLRQHEQGQLLSGDDLSKMLDELQAAVRLDSGDSE